jgi:hypothetical protein
MHYEGSRVYFSYLEMQTQGFGKDIGLRFDFLD